MNRRIALLLATVLALLLTDGRLALQSWPQKPIMLIVPFASGGGTDAFARPLAMQLDQQLGVRVLIDNRAGGGGTVGAAAAAKAAPDGYTFFVGAAHHAIAQTVYPKLTYNIEKDFVPIGMISRVPHVVVLGPGKVPAKTLSELVAHARANPAKINYASGGSGTTHHFAGELFKLVTKTQIQHVPYRGAGPMMQDLLAGHVDMAFDGLGSSANQVREVGCAGLPSPRPSASPRCRTSRRLRRPECLASKSRPGMHFGHRRIHRQRSLSESPRSCRPRCSQPASSRFGKQRLRSAVHGGRRVRSICLV